MTLPWAARQALVPGKGGRLGAEEGRQRTSSSGIYQPISIPASGLNCEGAGRSLSEQAVLAALTEGTCSASRRKACSELETFLRWEHVMPSAASGLHPQRRV